MLQSDSPKPVGSVPDYPESFSRLEGELRVRADGAFRLAHELLRSLEAISVYFIDIIPRLTIFDRQAMKSGAPRDIMTEGRLEENIEKCIHKLYYLNINSYYFSEAKFAELSGMFPLLPLGCTAPWHDPSTWENVIDKKTQKLKKKFLSEDPSKVTEVVPEAVGPLLSRLQRLQELSNEVRSFLARLELNPYEALRQTTPATPNASPERNSTQAGCKAAKPTSQSRGGRPSDTDADEDRRIAEAWHSGSYRTYEDLDKKLDKPKGSVKRAIDRHRHRKGAGKPPLRGSRQDG